MDRKYIYQCLVLLPSLALALPQTATDSASPAFPTMSAQDGVGVPEGGAGSTTTTEDQGGASGSDNGAWSLGTGGIVGISVGIALVVIAIGKIVGSFFPSPLY
jgi:hypothetical protein